MKTIAFNRLPMHPIVVPPKVEVIPDSAIVLPGRPDFIPDFDTSWIGVAYPAFRIGRLGKNIAPRFASRYYDALTVAFRIVPVTIASGMHSADSTPGLLSMFDNCLALGEWQPVPSSWPVEITVGNLRYSLTGKDLDIDEAIAAISSYATLKMGDIVMPCRLPDEHTVEPSTVIEASIAGTPALTLRLK